MHSCMRLLAAAPARTQSMHVPAAWSVSYPKASPISIDEGKRLEAAEEATCSCPMHYLGHPTQRAFTISL